MESHKMSKLLQLTVTVRPGDIMVRRWHHRSHDPGGFPGPCLALPTGEWVLQRAGCLGGGRARCQSLSCLQTGLARVSLFCSCWHKVICRNMPPVRSSARRQADYKKSTFLLGYLRPENHLYSEQHFNTYFTLI